MKEVALVERKGASSLIVIRVSIAPEVPGSTLHRSEYFKIQRCCALSGRRRSRRQRGVCSDFVNLEHLSAQSLKMLIGVGFAYVYS